MCCDYGSRSFLPRVESRLEPSEPALCVKTSAVPYFFFAKAIEITSYENLLFIGEKGVAWGGVYAHNEKTN